MNEFTKLATKNDFYKIKKWLEDEYERNEEGFWDNLNAIEDYFYKNELFIEKIDSFPVGFITGPLDGPDIICIKEEYRRKGVGKRLFEYIYDKAKRERVAVIRVLCQPETSIPFWQKMGFDILLEEEKNYGYMALNYTNKLPVGKKVNLFVSSYSESVFLNKTERANQSLKCDAVLGQDGKIYLKNRAIIFNNRKKDNDDLVISIKVNNQLIYFDKVKYPKARELGVEIPKKEGYVYYIDKINYDLL